MVPVEEPTKETTTVPKAAPAAKPSLAEEIALLERAQLELTGGDYTQALKTITEYRRRIPQATFSAERDVAEVLALCALGRKGAPLVKTVLERTSKLPIGSRVNAACK